MSGVEDAIDAVLGYRPDMGWYIYAPDWTGGIMPMGPGFGYYMKAKENCVWDVNDPAP